MTHHKPLSGLRALGVQSFLVLLQHSLLGDGDVVAGGVLDHVHHLVGLADDVVRRLGVMGIGGEANRRPNVQIQSFFFAEHADAQGIAQAFCHGQGLIFSGLRQEHNELITAIAEGVIDQAQLCLDQVADLRQQFAADQVTMGIVDLLEVIQIYKEDAELVAEA